MRNHPFDLLPIHIEHIKAQAHTIIAIGFPIIDSQNEQRFSICAVEFIIGQLRCVCQEFFSIDSVRDGQIMWFHRICAIGRRQPTRHLRFALFPIKLLLICHQIVHLASVRCFQSKAIWKAVKINVLNMFPRSANHRNQNIFQSFLTDVVTNRILISTHGCQRRLLM